MVDFREDDLPPLRNQRNRIGPKNLSSLSHLHEAAGRASLSKITQYPVLTNIFEGESFGKDYSIFPNYVEEHPKSLDL